MLFNRASSSFFFFFNGTATTEIYTYGHPLSLHDALPISGPAGRNDSLSLRNTGRVGNEYRRRLAPKLQYSLKAARLSANRLGISVPDPVGCRRSLAVRSEEHTSELQSLMRISYAVFCLKKKKKTYNTTNTNMIYCK